MSESKTFSCFFVGSESRLIRCAELVLEKGHQILGIVTDDPAVISWTKQRNLSRITPDGDIRVVFERQPFDYLFSVNNFHLLPKNILGLPRELAINFHDAPLPKYAGVNATNWAILSGESTHGVTWHAMTERVDAGDILKQASFPLQTRETALTLNGLCYEKSIESFAELLDDLANARVQAIPQDLSQRTYFPRWKRPHASCTIDWTSSALQIDRLALALDYGSYPNPLGMPKLYLGSRAVVAKSAEVLDAGLDVVPGTITEVGGPTISVATATSAIRLGEFFSLDGERLAPADFLPPCGLRQGDVLPSLDGQRAAAITATDAAIAKHEGYWIDRLASLEPIQIPYAKSPTWSRSKTNSLSKSFVTPSSFLAAQHADDAGSRVLAALALYLSRLGSQASFDVAFRDSRSGQEFEGHDIFFASHPPLRFDIDPQLTFPSFHDATRRRVRAGCAHGTYARDLVLRHPKLRDTSVRTSQIRFAIERTEGLSDPQDNGEFDLVVVIPDDAKELIWSYNPHEFDADAIQQMQQQFAVLLSDIAARPDCPVGELSITPENDRRRLLDEWNHTDIEFPQTSCLHESFAQQARKSPDAVAVVLGDDRLTYRQLNRRANFLAHQLRELGVGPDVIVGLCMERSLDLLVGLIGILKAGGAYLPLDPTYPKDRLAFMLSDAQASAIVTQQNMLDELPDHSAQTVLVDTLDCESAVADECWDETPTSGVAPENLAYVIYTSGSTGRPKGVLINHGNVMRLFEATNSWFEFSGRDVWTLFHSYAFDFSVWEIWGALLYGGRLVVVPYEVSRSPHAFCQLLCKEGVTVLNQTPSAFRQLMDAEEAAEGTPPLALRLVIFGGEALDVNSLKPWVDRHGDQQPRLVNMYGITETTVHVTYRPITAEDVHHGGKSAIGVPIPDLQTYVLDERLQPVPIGIVGELYVGGAGLARGYLNRQDLTRERFIPNPFSNKADARLYKTGDLGRYHPDGDLEYLGRSDQQVQLRGFRVEPGEIEAALHEHPAVGQAVVIVREDKAGDQRLVAYLTPRSKPLPDATQWRTHLRSRLPDYMVPQHFIQIDTVPLTANGKLDRRALPAPRDVTCHDKTYVAARSPAEKIIADIWQDILDVPYVSAKATFFELGGHSLLLPKMLERLERSFGAGLSIVQLFRYPTVESLASLVARGPNQNEAEVRPSFAKAVGLAEQQKAALQRRKKAMSVRRR